MFMMLHDIVFEWEYSHNVVLFTLYLQRVFLGTSLFVFTSMIVFHYGYHKPGHYANRIYHQSRPIIQQTQNQEPPSSQEQDQTPINQYLLNGETPSSENALPNTEDTDDISYNNNETQSNVPNEVNQTQNPVDQTNVVISDENYFIHNDINNNVDSETVLQVTYEQAQTAKCNGQLCNINTMREAPIAKDNREQCKSIDDCVTVVIRTSNRLENTLRLVGTILQVYPKMNIVIVDDVNTTYTHNNVWNKLLSESELLTYIQVLPGVHNGRSLGVKVASTPFVLMLEDDFHFTKNTNINKMLSVLKSADISVVAGTVGQPWSFEGALKLYTNDSGAHLRHYPAVHYASIPGFMNCFSVDVVKTFLMVRRRDVIETRVWNRRWPLFDHVDFAINMRLGNRNVAYCPNIMTEHLSQTNNDRHMPLISTFRESFLAKWNLSSFKACPRDSYLTFSPTCDKTTTT